MREVLLVAGEASGDLHAAGVVDELRRIRPELHLAGIGGSCMAAAGVELLEHADRLAVMGFVEVIRHLPRHYGLLRQLERRIRGGQCALVVLVDYPGFNMKLAATAAAARVPVLYYITPQVWAWGAGRLAQLAKTVTKAAVILPFEEALLRRHGVDATFVGHPLLDRAATLPDRAAARRELGLDPARRMLALFPGSRAQEIERHAADFVGAAELLCARHDDLDVIVSGASTVQLDRRRWPFRIVDSASFLVLRAATAALCKSGTTTLEAAVAGCPLVVAYRTSGWTYSIARRVVRIPHIGLVNVVAERQVAPELIQGALTPASAAAALDPLLEEHSAARQASLEGLAEVRARLGQPGAAARVARLASELAR